MTFNWKIDVDEKDRSLMIHFTFFVKRERERAREEKTILLSTNMEKK